MIYQEKRFIADNPLLWELKNLSMRPGKEKKIKAILKRIFRNPAKNRIELLQAKNASFDFAWQAEGNIPALFQVIFSDKIFIVISENNRCSDMASALAAIA